MKFKESKTSLDGWASKSLHELVFYAMFACIILAAQCSSDTSSNRVEGVVSDSTTVDSIYSEVNFISSKINFDTITEGSMPEGIYYLESTGTEPAIIRSVRCSYGCIVKNFPKTPLLPSMRDSIVVQFNSSGKPFNQNKKIFVALEGKEDLITLIFSGYVLPVVNE